jgi:hypothetical protein
MAARLPVHARPIRERFAKLDDGRSGVSDSDSFMSAKIVRRCLHVPYCFFHLADRSRYPGMIHRLSLNGLSDRRHHEATHRKSDYDGTDYSLH